ncbi:glycoside hydrolase family 5 protein [Rhizobium binxianense]
MKRVLAAVFFTLCLVTAAHPASLVLSRGVGVHEWLNWSPLNGDGSYRWPPYRSRDEWLSGSRPLGDWPGGSEFRRIRSMGFDFVRLSVDPGPLLASSGARREQALDVLQSAVRQITDADLKVVFNLHSVSQVPAYDITMLYEGADSPGVAQYREMVTAVAGMLAKFDIGEVALEPYNEPAFYPCDRSGSEDWQRIMAATVADIRAVSADLTIVATGACGGSITGLTDLDPGFDDPNIYYSFHMYEPHSFTHQRSDDAEGFSSGLPWPAAGGSPDTVIENLRAHMRDAGLNGVRQAAVVAGLRRAIRNYFAEDWGLPQMQARLGEAADWAKAHNIPSERLFMGEFGVILMSPEGRSGAFDVDRLRYMTALRQEADRFHIPWSVWEYSNPYGMSLILPKGPAIADQALLKALGLETGTSD